MFPYFQYREHIRSGDLLVWTSRDINFFRNLSLKIVRMFTESSYDHVAIAWNTGNRLFAVEAAPPEVRIYPLSRMLPFYVIPMHIEWRSEYDEKLLEHIGEEYSYMQAIRSYFGKPSDDKEWQCAEFANHFYNSVGLQGEFGYTPRSIVERALDISSEGLIKVF